MLENRNRTPMLEKFVINHLTINIINLKPHFLINHSY